jgi:hypothetical protein
MPWYWRSYTPYCCTVCHVTNKKAVCTVIHSLSKARQQYRVTDIQAWSTCRSDHGHTLLLLLLFGTEQYCAVALRGNKDVGLVSLQQWCNTAHTHYVSIRVDVYHQCVNARSTSLHVRLACEFWVCEFASYFVAESQMITMLRCVESTRAWMQ